MRGSDPATHTAQEFASASKSQTVTTKAEPAAAELRRRGMVLRYSYHELT